MAYLIDAASPELLDQSGGILMQTHGARSEEKAEADSAAEVSSEEGEDDSRTPVQKTAK